MVTGFVLQAIHLNFFSLVWLIPFGILSGLCVVNMKHFGFYRRDVFCFQYDILPFTTSTKWGKLQKAWVVSLLQQFP